MLHVEHVEPLWVFEIGSDKEFLEAFSPVLTSLVCQFCAQNTFMSPEYEKHLVLVLHLFLKSHHHSHCVFSVMPAAMVTAMFRTIRLLFWHREQVCVRKQTLYQTPTWESSPQMKMTQKVPALLGFVLQMVSPLLFLQTRCWILSEHSRFPSKEHLCQRVQ